MLGYRTHFTNAKLSPLLKSTSSGLGVGVIIEGDCFTPEDIVATIDAHLLVRDVPHHFNKFTLITIVENKIYLLNCYGDVLNDLDLKKVLQLEE